MNIKFGFSFDPRKGRQQIDFFLEKRPLDVGGGGGGGESGFHLVTFL